MCRPRSLARLYLITDSLAEEYSYSSYSNYYLNDHHLIEIDTQWK